MPYSATVSVLSSCDLRYVCHGQRRIGKFGKFSHSSHTERVTVKLRNDGVL